MVEVADSFVSRTGETVTETEVFTYDAASRVVQVDWSTTDDNAPEVEVTRTYAYDAQGELESSEWTDDASILYANTFRAGVLSAVLLEADYAGYPYSQQMEYAWTESHVGAIDITVVSDPEPCVDHVTITASYDGGKVTRQEEHTTDGCERDDLVVREYEYDDEGRLIRMRSTGEASDPSTWSFTYDALGRGTSLTFDDDSSDEVRRTFIYDCP